ALTLAFWLIALLCAVTPAIYFAQQFFSGTQPSPWWLRLSPAYGPYLIFNRVGASPMSEFWWNFPITLPWSLLLLAAAAALLTRSWRLQLESRDSSGWSRRWREALCGSTDWRRRLAARWLDANAFAWLARRDRSPERVLAMTIGCIICLWLICWT